MAISTAFDAIFARAVQGTTIPVAYLRSLANQESGMHPTAIGPGKERGLLQIHPVTLAAYNTATNFNVTPDQSADPSTNAAIAVWLLQRISHSFGKNHPQSLKEDWTSHRWVGLVTQAYNAGESEINGVGRIVTRLELQNIPIERITFETVAQANTVTKDNPWLSDTNRLAYVKRVVTGYLGEPPPPKTRDVGKAEGRSSLPWGERPCSPSSSSNDASPKTAKSE